MWKKIALGVLAVAVAAVATVPAFLSSRPSIRQAERSVLVAAPPEVVRTQLADPRRWLAWSPWEGLGPGASRTYGGPLEGEGASVYWSGHDRVGQGRLTVMRASTEVVEVERELERPSWSLSDFEFRLVREGAATRVSWRMRSESKDGWAAARRMLPGGDDAFAVELERGLARLKAVSEAQASPRRWRVERSARVAASPAAVRSRLVDLHRWAGWSPWEQPGVPRRYGGPPEGTGASAYWSDNTAGSGRLTIVGVTPGKVAIELELSEPVQSLADLEFTLAPDGSDTQVTWGVTGEVEVAGEALGRTGDPEATIGKDLERGLVQLQAVVEADARGTRASGRAPSSDGVPTAARNDGAQVVNTSLDRPRP